MRTHLGEQLIKPFVMPPSVMLLYMQLCGASAWIAWAFDRCRSAIAWSAACWAVMSRQLLTGQFQPAVGISVGPWLQPPVPARLVLGHVLLHALPLSHLCR
jgi:hypothetical protein